MHTIIRRIKYLVLIPVLVMLRKVLIGNKNKNIIDFPSNDSLFFIMGSGRNGSTLLALLLGRHKEVFLPPEQYVLPYSIISWHLILFKEWNIFSKEILKDYRCKNQNWNLEQNDFDLLEKEIIGLNKKYRKASNIFRLIFRFYAAKNNPHKRIFGDHSPNITLFYKSIYSEFPNAKYIFLVRNPLDVILSYSKMSKNPASNPKYASWKWNNSIKAYHWIKNRPNSKVLLIKYEDLVLDPKDITKKIFSFLGVDYQDVISPSPENQTNDPLGTKKYSFHANLYKPISGRSINKWKERLSEKKY